MKNVAGDLENGSSILTPEYFRANELLQKAKRAYAVFQQFDQQHTDAIVERVFRAGFDQRVPLAKMAQAETGMGVWEHKVLKNVLATQFVYHSIKNEKTVGILASDEKTGITEIAQPLGTVLAIIPVTNPAATVLFKILLCLKTRNPVIICPPPKALKCCAEAARICYAAAMAADAPDDCIQCLPESSRGLTHALMTHKDLALILATGGTEMVRSAYSSGTPAIGVGPGNVPVLIDQSADVPFAIEAIISSKTFDNGMLCASEQAVVVEKSIADRVRDEFTRQGCFFLNPDQARQVSALAFQDEPGAMNPEVVGQSAAKVAALAGFSVPAGAKILLAPLDGVGPAHPLSGTLLAPVLAFYVTDDFEAAVKRCIDLNYQGGIGHTASIYANDDGRVEFFAAMMNAGLVLINTPSSQGATGGIFNTLVTSFTLGGGAGGKNITTENITARNLINVKRACRRRDDERWARFDRAKYLDPSLGADAVLREYNRNY